LADSLVRYLGVAAAIQWGCGRAGQRNTSDPGYPKNGAGGVLRAIDSVQSKRCNLGALTVWESDMKGFFRKYSLPLFACSAFFGLASFAHANTIVTTGMTTGILTTNFTTPPPMMLGTQSVTGSGHGSVLGNFTFAETNDVTLNTVTGNFTITNGMFTNTYSGGTLFGTYSGGGTTGGACGSGLSCGNFLALVTGGTGAYSGYTGSINEKTTLVIATNVVTSTFSGTLSVPGPTIDAGLQGLIFAGGGLLVHRKLRIRCGAQMHPA
jgi:hypothetical protein